MCEKDEMADGRGVKVGLHGVWGIVACMHVPHSTLWCIHMYIDVW